MDSTEEDAEVTVESGETKEASVEEKEGETTGEDTAVKEELEVEEKTEESVEVVEKTEETIEVVEKTEETVEEVDKTEETLETVEKPEENIEVVEKPEETVEAIEKTEETVEVVEKNEETVEPVEKTGEVLEGEGETKKDEEVVEDVEVKETVEESKEETSDEKKEDTTEQQVVQGDDKQPEDVDIEEAATAEEGEAKGTDDIEEAGTSEDAKVEPSGVDTAVEDESKTEDADTSKADDHMDTTTVSTSETAQVPDEGGHAAEDNEGVEEVNEEASQDKSEKADTVSSTTNKEAVVIPTDTSKVEEVQTTQEATPKDEVKEKEAELKKERFSPDNIAIPPTPPPLPMVTVERDMSEIQSSVREETSSEMSEDETPVTALQPVWSFGLNRHVPVINLSTETKSVVFYTCAHLGIVYNFARNRQMVLQGHSNAITCTGCSADKRWIVTGDKGPDSMVIIWDSHTGMPVRSMFEPHPEGVVGVALSPDARYLATLSAEKAQTFAVWDWTTGEELPMCSASLNPSYGLQTYIAFCQTDPTHVVTNSDNQVLFYCWKGGQLEYFSPPLTDKDFNKQVGRFSQSAFLPNSTKALTATSQGLCVVWDSNKPLIKASDEPTPDKKAVKLVPLHERGITVLTITEKFIVTGDTAGTIKFFDHKLMLIYWYQHFNFGPVNGISFRYYPKLGTCETEEELKNYPTDATIPEDTFIVHDFVIGTNSAVFAGITVAGTIVKIIHRDHDSPIHTLATHPALPRVAIGGLSGLLKIWNYTTKKTQVSRYFDKGNQIRCCAFDKRGIFLAVGFTNGHLHILDAETLQDALPEPFTYAREAVTHVTFSDDALLLATVDDQYTTTLYRAGGEGEDSWVYVGRHRAHYKPIRDILFGHHIDTKEPRLLTLGEDRYMVEYNLSEACRDHLPLLSQSKIEQGCFPLCMAWYPNITKEQFLLAANADFKFKLYNTTTKMCRKTVLGPTYGSPVQKMVVLPHFEDARTPSRSEAAAAEPPADRRYVAFVIEDKVGLLALPLDGNPHMASAMIAHPAGVTNLAVSFDGAYVFTAGGTDSTAHMWKVHKNVLEAQIQLGGDDLTPFYDLLEGGRNGELFRQLEDYFYYAQLRSQGINTMSPRKVSVKIPISEVPFVMRAMGFFPTEQEIEDMLNEIKFSEYVETGQYVNELDLGQFIKLYINHRPAFGLSLERIRWAFEVLGGKGADGGDAVVDREDLFDILQSRGEHMIEYELAEYLTTLLGFNPEGGSCELESFDPFRAGDLLDNNFPKKITADQFTRDILCLGAARPTTAISDASMPTTTAPTTAAEVQTD